MNRKIKLNPQIRQEIAANILAPFDKETPRPTVSRAHELNELRALEQWKARREQYQHQLAALLPTFSTLDEMLETWPAAEKFVPRYLRDPARNFKLPKRAAAA